VVVPAVAQTNVQRVADALPCSRSDSGPAWMIDWVKSEIVELRSCGPSTFENRGPHISEKRDLV
jgi:hypothetical protein